MMKQRSLWKRGTAQLLCGRAFRGYAAFCAVLLTVLPMHLLADDTKKKVAVLEFGALGVSADVSTNVAEVVAASLSQIAEFNVITRNDLVSVMSFESQRELLGCTDAECYGDIGNMVGVQYLVTGMVGKVGKTFTLTISMIDVAAGSAVGRAQEEEGEIGKLPAAARRAVLRLFGSKYNLRDLVGEGGLFVQTDPEGARVFLDDVEQKGRTPITIDNVRAGDHVLRLVYKDLERIVPVLVPPDKIAKYDLALAVVRVKFLSAPFDAKVYIDAIERGTTPFLIPNLAGERHRVKFTKFGYEDHEEDVTFDLTKFRKAGGKAFEVKAELKPQPVVLLVSSVPSGAEVFFDSEGRNQTPVELQAVLPGKHVLEIKKNGFVAEKRTILVKPGVKAEVELAMPELKAHAVYESAVGLRRGLTVGGLIGGGVAIALGGILGTTGWMSQNQAEENFNNYQLEIDPEKLAELREDAKGLNDYAQVGVGLGYSLVGVGVAVLAAAGANHLTMPAEPDYTGETEIAGGSQVSSVAGERKERQEGDGDGDPAKKGDAGDAAAQKAGTGDQAASGNETHEVQQ